MPIIRRDSIIYWFFQMLIFNFPTLKVRAKLFPYSRLTSVVENTQTIPSQGRHLLNFSLVQSYNSEILSEDRTHYISEWRWGLLFHLCSLSKFKIWYRTISFAFIFLDTKANQLRFPSQYVITYPKHAITITTVVHTIISSFSNIFQ